MLRTLHNKIQRVSDLVTEYDTDEDPCRNPNPALHDFVQKLKVILSGKNEITKNDATNYSNTESNRHDNIPAGSSPSSQTDISHSSNDPKAIEALGNHVVLTEIFKCGNFRDLKNFRLVNKQWKGIANSGIIQRRLWKLSMKEKFNTNDIEASFELNDCIEASGGSFPLTALDFSDVDDYTFLDNPAFLRFWDVIGPSIKQVKFSNFGRITANDFHDLLLNKMPNVDHIDAGKIFFSNKQNWQLEIFLPHLKTIRFIDDEPEHPEHDVPFKVQWYYKALLLAATNLKIILDFQVQLTDTAIETRKMDCVQTFNFALELRSSHWRETFSTLCDKFSNSKPKLTSLTLSRGPLDPYDDEEFDIMVSPELAQSLQRILTSSKDTLKHLHCVPGFFPVEFQLPKFPNLESLSVIDNDDYDCSVHSLPRVFPDGCNCSETFPNLQTVSLNVRLSGSQTLYKYFPDQAFPSVTTLEFSDNFQLGKSLKTYFPNVCHIKIIDFERMIACTKKEFFKKKLPSHLDNQIECLEFQQCLLARSRLEFQLNSLFTGVPTHICTKLLGMQNHCNARGDDEDIMFVKEILKVVQTQHYAFRNCEGLRQIKIIFNHKDNVHFRISKSPDYDLDSEDGSGSEDEKAEAPKPVITPVSCIYGFSLMPKLEQVIIGYDHYLPNAAHIAEVFKPFAQFPYVTIIHEPTITS